MGFTNLIANKWSHKENEINYGQLGSITFTYIENMYYFTIWTISSHTELFFLKSKIEARSRNKNEFEGNKTTYVQDMGKKVFNLQMTASEEWKSKARYWITKFSIHYGLKWI